MALNRDACERRVYRLAALLTGDPVAATRVIEAVVDAQPDVRRVGSARLDRLTVLRSREIEPAPIADPAVPPAGARALAALPGQAREAWVLTHTCRLGLRETSRAMDCSTTATARHLERADQALAAGLGDAVETARERLLAYSMSLTVPAFYRARRRRRRQLGRIGLALSLLAVIAAILWLAGRLGRAAGIVPPGP